LIVDNYVERTYNATHARKEMECTHIASDFLGSLEGLVEIAREGIVARNAQFEMLMGKPKKIATRSWK
jgi:hypothetical protein